MSDKPPAQFTVIVPARLAATRLPNKPLAEIDGTPMILRVLQQARQSHAQAVVAAVEDDAVYDAVTAAGFRAVMTEECESGTHRIAAAAALLHLADEAIVVNVQGDEPFMEPAVIDQVAATLCERATPERGGCVAATAARRCRSEAEYADSSAVKIVTRHDQTALYFSRAAIPYVRDKTNTPHHAWQERLRAVRIHLGIYAYRAGFLRTFLGYQPTELEQLEELEQLRILGYGNHIAVADVDSDSIGIDTPDDLQQANRRAKQ